MGMGSEARFSAIRTAMGREPRKFELPCDEKGRLLHVSQYFGTNTLDLQKMQRALSKDVFTRLRSTIDMGKYLDPEIADAVALTIRDWALSHSVTHFCHWFQPQTGSTAEKHDAFLSFDKNRLPIESFSGAQLIQSEPDASSFPSGGMRTTFEARGYTAWDPSSPVFIMEHRNGKTLCIPSVFISYHGAALDEKTALLKSIDVLSHKCRDLLHLIGDTSVKRVIPTLGIEQEYFLMDRAYYSLRPDLVMTGRTLLGGQPPKGQQLEDHYFGSIPSRVQAFMSEMEFELYKLGVPIKTRHNEVAPSQFETAPIFEEANIATDHNQLVMEIVRKVAARHGYHALLHEKPFSGINGSGKHNNWSLMALSQPGENDGENLLDPGRTPHQNLRFLLLLMSVLKAVHRHGGLLRAGVACAGNDHRLGANEAPPAILSVFLGEMLGKILNDIESGAIKDPSPEGVALKLGLNKLPQVMRDNTDRNRTSPFAFTGNKFEFRAVGSSASTAFPVTLLNAAVADAMDELSQSISSKKATGVTLDKAILETIREAIHATRAIRFDGNNYADEWVKEAQARGLPNLRKTPEALAQLLEPSSREVLTRLGIFSEAELTSRFHVRTERYVKNVLIEVDTLRSMVETQILPACYAYHAHLATGIQAAKGAALLAPQTDIITRLHDLVTQLQLRRADLTTKMTQLDAIPSEEKKARVLADDILPRMDDIRSTCDELESLVADGYWPLPKYREMLFLS